MSRRARHIEGKFQDNLIVTLAIIAAIAVVIATIIIAIRGRGKSNISNRSEIIQSKDNQLETESASSTIGNKLNETSKDNQLIVGTTENSKDKKDNTSEQKNSKPEAKEQAKTENSKNSESSEKTAGDNQAEKNTEKKEEVKNEDAKNGNDKNENAKNEEVKKEVEPTFERPVEGEIIKGFSKENLVYSNTLQEWITHLAVDIKSESREVVKSAADGKVVAIKNDPRYGLTVIVEHSAGFKTIYSNLLTAEFVVEGEEVKKGQTLGTIGASATFEIADEAHLHFEMLRNSEYVDPSIYIKF